jgi:hypothetical protein
MPSDVAERRSRVRIADLYCPVLSGQNPTGPALRSLTCSRARDKLAVLPVPRPRHGQLPAQDRFCRERAEAFGRLSGSCPWHTLLPAWSFPASPGRPILRPLGA